MCRFISKRAYNPGLQRVDGLSKSFESKGEVTARMRSEVVSSRAFVDDIGDVDIFPPYARFREALIQNVSCRSLKREA